MIGKIGRYHGPLCTMLLNRFGKRTPCVGKPELYCDTCKINEHYCEFDPKSKQWRMKKGENK